MQRLLGLINKKRILIPFPLPIAKLTAKFFEILPKPLITSDQLRLLKYDNIASGKYKTNSDIGMPSKRYFNDEVKKYCYMWIEGGQFMTKFTASILINIWIYMRFFLLYRYATDRRRSALSKTILS